jgi:hypothetical protein
MTQVSISLVYADNSEKTQHSTAVMHMTCNSQTRAHFIETYVAGVAVDMRFYTDVYNTVNVIIVW